MQISIEGPLVGATAKPYDFTDQLGERRNGTAQRIFVVTSFEEAPQEVRLVAGPQGDAQHKVLRELGYGAYLRCLVDVGAQGNGGRSRVSLRLLSFDVIDADGEISPLHAAS